MQKTLGQEDPLEENVATHPSILAWEIPYVRKPPLTTSPNGVNRWRFGEHGAQEEGMEVRCPFPIPCPKHHFHLAVPELETVTINR